ncbi:response regulator transcription factor [Nocardia sp. alder85J]|uniref:response regulator transcription factor n=1 Tax=Nocardia sp. alder85J TaxID=2862949 RepID=UPI001CD21D47|nr:response regulator transcription factor [Nocardia sp. alder85J]MCX4094100.1 response regulator transcription factor [Nocardia sp. alder85J]
MRSFPLPLPPRETVPGEADSPRPIRLLVADDHTLFREGLAEICDAEPDLTVVGQADNGRAAVALALREHPDVVLLDVGMPGPRPGELVSTMLRIPSAPKVAMLGGHHNPGLIAELVALGAHAYISTNTTRGQLLAAVRTVGSSEEQVVLSVPRNTLAQWGRPTPGPLSARQLDVLRLVAQGLSNAQIATKLHISEGTVKRHLTNIYLELHVRSRLNAVNRATQLCLL